MYPPLSIGQQLSIIESWSTKQLTAALEDYFDVDDGTLNFNISKPMHPPHRILFNFDDISMPAVIRNMINICPDVVECFSIYKPLLVNYAIDAGIDLGDFKFTIPAASLKESLLYKFKSSSVRLDYFLDILEYMKVELKVCDSDIYDIINNASINYVSTNINDGCVNFERFLKITHNKTTFIKLLTLYTAFPRVASYIEKLQSEISLESNERIKDVVGIDCIEWLIMFKLKEDGNVDFVTKQIAKPEYMRVVNKFKLLHGHLAK